MLDFSTSVVSPLYYSRSFVSAAIPLHIVSQGNKIHINQSDSLICFRDSDGRIKYLEFVEAVMPSSYPEARVSTDPLPVVCSVILKYFVVLQLQGQNVSTFEIFAKSYKVLIVCVDCFFQLQLQTFSNPSRSSLLLLLSH